MGKMGLLFTLMVNDVIYFKISPSASLPEKTTLPISQEHSRTSEHNIPFISMA